MKTTMGQLLINEALPPELRDYRRTINKKSIRELLHIVADRYPERYNEVAHALMQLGADVATRHGREASLSLDSMKIGREAARIRRAVETGVRRRLEQGVDEKEIVKFVGRHMEPLRETNYKEQLAANNPMAKQVESGARGNKAQFAAVNVGPLLVMDHRDNVIPVPILHSYAEGLDPVEYWAGSYGDRKGVIDLKMATPRGGFMGKQLALAAHRLLVTEHDCGTANGIPVDADDPDNVGALLARQYGEYAQNTTITPKIAKRLKRRKTIVVRSPLTCQAKGGVCARCAGVRERGELPDIGDNIGVAAAQAISEPVSQSLISSKHCLAQGTLVRMADYTVRAVEDIQVGDYVLGADHTGVTFPVRVVNVYDNGERECVRTTLQLNQSGEPVTFESTAEHKALSRNYKWDGKARRAGGQGNYVWQYSVQPIGKPARSKQLLLPRQFTATGLAHEPRALLLGLLLGDGCYTEAVHGVHLSCADPTLIFELADYLAEHNVRLTRLVGHHGIYYRLSSVVEQPAVRDATTGRVLPGLRNPAMRMLAEFTMRGKYAHEKEIPAVAYGWDNDSVAQLLSGLFITDGSFYLGNSKWQLHASFGVTSRRMMQQVRELLAWRFGVYGTPHVDNYGGRKRPVYYLKITNAESVRRLVENVPMRGIKRKKIEQWRDKLRPLNCKNINRLIVKDQQPLGPRPTYDIEVDHPDHLFVLANGAIVSNSGGIAGAGPTAAGFDAINSLVQVPKTFKEGAAIARVDGVVNAIANAPQGGTFVHVGEERHFAPPGMKVHVRKGDAVEAGDVLSEGLPNPAEIVRHKGIGAGRWHFMHHFRDTLRASKIAASRRNIELLSRGLINHARIVDPDGPPDTLPDDIVEFNTITRGYTPRPGTRTLAPYKAKGMYLEEPVLHYSIGTRVTPRMATELKRYGVSQVKAHGDLPSFQPEMVRAMEALAYAPDWVVRLGGFHLKKQLLRSVHRGVGTREHQESFIPALARGVEFGKAPGGAAAY